MSGSTKAKEQSAGWGVVLLLAAAQFVMVLDSTVMNVSISQVVADLNTTVVGIQTAITAYTLVMAALMLAGAKLGDLWGSRRAFTLGLIIYGAGSLTTALSPNLPTLLFGWSFLEGLGAVLVIPAIAALVASTYQGHMRALAFGIMGGVAGAAAAAGPIIGGWVTTYLSWRIVFASEVVIMLVILAFVRVLKRTEPRGGKLDMGGAVLSARTGTRAGRVWHSAEQPLGLDRTESRRSRDLGSNRSAARPVACDLAGRHRGLPADDVRQARTPNWRCRRGTAARHEAIPDTAAALRTEHPDGTAVHHHGHVLRDSALPANGPGIERV